MVRSSALTAMASRSSATCCFVALNPFVSVSRWPPPLEDLIMAVVLNGLELAEPQYWATEVLVQELVRHGEFGQELRDRTGDTQDMPQPCFRRPEYQTKAGTVKCFSFGLPANRVGTIVLGDTIVGLSQFKRGDM
jgi:hypothetical protein